MRSAGHKFWFIFGIVSLSGGCDHKRLSPITPGETPQNLCHQDIDCGDALLCIFQRCEPKENFACKGDQKPVLTLDIASKTQKPEINFGNVLLGNTVGHKIQVQNVGECLLTLHHVQLSDATVAGFHCQPCDLLSYPVQLAPGQQHTITVAYSPLRPGPARGELLIASDSMSPVDSKNITRVALNATYSGKPMLTMEPITLDFGYLDFDMYNDPLSAPQTVRITNRGSGSASVVLQWLFISPNMDSGFRLSDGLSPIEPTSSDAIQLLPYDAADPSTWFDIPIHFAPQRLGNFQARLVVQGIDPASEQTTRLETILTGTTLGAPAISVHPTQLDFPPVQGGNMREPIMVGDMYEHTLTISNIGKSDLNISQVQIIGSNEFTVDQYNVQSIAPGGNTMMRIRYQPVNPSDANHVEDPEQDTQASLLLLSNDPVQPAFNVTLSGLSKTVLSDEFLKIDMKYERADTALKFDFRDVDMTLESDFWGEQCKKPSMRFHQGPDGNYIGTLDTDYCEQWTQRLDGNYRWFSAGPADNPQRVVAYDIGKESQDIFNVNLHYLEDCKNIPRGWLAQILGITLSTAAGILGAQAGVPVAIPPNAIADLIKDNCWGTGDNRATIRVFINGKEHTTRHVTINAKGDCIQALQIKRENGAFTVLDTPVQNCL